jgi:hypothetical protein
MYRTLQESVGMKPCVVTTDSHESGTACLLETTGLLVGKVSMGFVNN